MNKSPKLLGNGRWAWSMGLNENEPYVIKPEIFVIMYPVRAYAHDTKEDAIECLQNAIIKLKKEPK